MSEKSGIPRLSVDSETKEILDKISDALQQAMIGLVKHGDLTTELHATEENLKSQIKSEGQVASNAVAATQKQCEAIEEAVRGSLARLMKEIQVYQDKTTRLNDSIKAESDSLRLAVEKLVVDAEQLSELCRSTFHRIDSVEGNLAALQQEIAKANRPWWQKLLG